MSKTKKALRITGYILAGIIFIFAISLYVICKWSVKMFNVSLGEILFTIRSPLKGADTSVIKQGLQECLPPIAAGLLAYIALIVANIKLKVNIILNIKLRKLNFSLSIRALAKRVVSLFILASFVLSIAYADSQYQLFDYIKSHFDTTTIYEDYYIHPDDVNIRADGDEKNLICIYLESMETTYASEEVGGAQPVNYIPNLTKLANENISFSDSDKLGGFRTTVGATWTMGALFATTSGIPFSFPIKVNSMNLREAFASRLTNLGDVLSSFGYNQYFLCGSNADFAGRKSYFEQHGGYNIIDLFTAREEGYIPSDYYVFWGYEDKYLYEIAKAEITQAYEAGKPFNFTMLTVDTHFPDGYLCDLCKSDYGSVAANVISCADRQINEFIEWCKTQPFYNDTVIMLLGDHPRMDTALVEGVESSKRTAYNSFINYGDNAGLTTQSRIFTHMDMFPTTLSAMGFEYDGSRIGLGTDMFSGEPTLAEELGFEHFNDELAKYSEYYLDNFS